MGAGGWLGEGFWWWVSSLGRGLSGCRERCIGELMAVGSDLLGLPVMLHGKGLTPTSPRDLTS